jgi:hypothetical protein
MNYTKVRVFNLKAKTIDSSHGGMCSVLLYLIDITFSPKFLRQFVPLGEIKIFHQNCRTNISGSINCLNIYLIQTKVKLLTSDVGLCSHQQTKVRIIRISLLS